MWATTPVRLHLQIHPSHLRMFRNQKIISSLNNDIPKSEFELTFGISCATMGILNLEVIGMVERTEYLQELIGWKDEQVIKVVTGIRRCGKSTLMLQYQAYLKAHGVAGHQIISVNFEELEYEELLDYKKLYAYLKERIAEGQTTYIFLDEIQKVPQFEKVVDSLYVKEGIDLYITGSNAYMLSSDLATLLTGRYVEIKMLPLSFAEYQTLTKLDVENAFADYLKNGGMPYVATMNRTAEKVDMYLEGIYDTVIVRDI